METAVVLVSGGVNSLVATGVAAKAYTPALMHVSFGQRTAERELACFRGICEHYKPKHQIAVPMPHFESVGGNARVDKRLPIEDARAIGADPPSTYVPGLIPTLLGLALNWATVIGARRIFIGASENDGPPAPAKSCLFPDHRRQVYHLYNQLIDMATGAGVKIELETPLVEMMRGEVVRLGRHLAVPFEASWSCLRSGEAPCGMCYGCASRAQGFVTAAVPDPIMLEEE